MRVNIYAEELLKDETPGNQPAIEIVKKTVNQQLFYGVRIYLKSAPELHYGTSDDDRSAVTFWAPWTKEKGNNPAPLVDLLDKAAEILLMEGKSRGDI